MMALIALALATPLDAQTTDPMFRSWKWDEEPQSARAAALGGAVVAFASDAGSAVLHPASLSLVSETDVRFSLRYAASTSIGLDRTMARWTLAQGAVVRPIGLSSGLGVYYRSPRSVGLDIDDAALPDGSSDRGRLAVDVRETGVAFGTALTPTLRVGIRLGAARLDVGGLVTSRSAGGAEVDVSSNGDDWEPSAGLSVLFTPDHRFQAGLTYDTELRWEAERTGPSGTLDYDLVSPPRLAAGVLFQPSTVVGLTGQVDWLGWSRVRKALVSPATRPDASEFALDDAVEGRFGLELRGEYGESPLWNRAVVRFGLHFRSRGLLEYVGADPVEQARFPGEPRRIEWSLGLAYGPVEVSRVRRKHSADWVIGIRHAF